VPIKNFLQLSNLEIQAMKEKIAQAEIFLEAMGNASTLKNRDSSRYVGEHILCGLIDILNAVFCIFRASTLIWKSIIAETSSEVT
jgi:hypothetical protein